MCLEIAKDAIFIADSHTQKNRDSLIFALKNLERIPSQILLMGDISNILMGNIKSSKRANSELLSVLENLGEKTELIYFEGNHDFNLDSVLNCAKIIKRNAQPSLFKYGKKSILIAHGDIFLNKKYEFYIRALTSNLSAKMLNALDFVSQGAIYKLIEKKVHNKKIREPFNIDSLIARRIRAYEKYIKNLNQEIDIVIEGHFHIGKIARSVDFGANLDFKYIALPSFIDDEKIFDMSQNGFCALKNSAKTIF